MDKTEKFLLRLSDDLRDFESEFVSDDDDKDTEYLHACVSAVLQNIAYSFLTYKGEENEAK